MDTWHYREKEKYMFLISGELPLKDFSCFLKHIFVLCSSSLWNILIQLYFCKFRGFLRWQ